MDNNRNHLGQLTPGNRLAEQSSNKRAITQKFLTTFREDFEKHGVDAIAKMRLIDPVSYVKIAASMIPKELKLDLNPNEMPEDELDKRILVLAQIINITIPNATPDEPEMKLIDGLVQSDT